MRIAPAAHAARPEPAEDSDDSPLTPRGMAAPPAQAPARRFEGDPSRPATIRIEAGRRPEMLRPREPERRPERVYPTARTERATLGQALKGLLRSRALALHAFLVLLVLGWITLFPATRASQEVGAAAPASLPAASPAELQTPHR